jgi:hypothetical protein
MQIGRRIYYDKGTGNPIVNTGERMGFNIGDVIETTIEEDFISYVALSERVPSTVGMIQLAYGQYDQDFIESNDNYRVDISGAEPSLVFSYPVPGEPEAPPVYRPPLSVEITEIQAENTKLREQLAQQNADFTAFQDFYFSNNPEQA